MTFSCPRCGEPLLSFQNEVPAFCPHCGLPQLRLSSQAVESPDALGSPASVPAGIEWPRALWIAAGVALAGVALPSLLPGAIVNGVTAGIGLLLMPLLALLLVVAYSRIRPPRPLVPTDGGTLGALLGMVMGGLLAAVTGATGFVLRYFRHSHAMDERISQAASQLPTQLSAAGAIPPEVLGLIQSPEFRAGTFILSHVFSMLLLMAVGSLGGWASAMLLRQRRERTIRES